MMMKVFKLSNNPSYTIPVPPLPLFPPPLLLLLLPPPDMIYSAYPLPSLMVGWRTLA